MLIMLAAHSWAHSCSNTATNAWRRCRVFCVPAVLAVRVQQHYAAAHVSLVRDIGWVEPKIFLLTLFCFAKEWLVMVCVARRLDAIRDSTMTHWPIRRVQRHNRYANVVCSFFHFVEHCADSVAYTVAYARPADAVADTGAYTVAHARTDAGAHADAHARSQRWLRRVCALYGVHQQGQSSHT